MVDKKITFPDCNEYNLKTINKRETIGGKVLVPAAAVIPAPLAYIYVVAVKKLVVEVRSTLFDSTENKSLVVVNVHSSTQNTSSSTV